MMTQPSSSRSLLRLIGGLYVAQGLSLGLVLETLPTVLRAQGASLELLSLLPLALLPWMLKVFWAPLVDNHGLARVGRRRTWLLPTQVLLIACLLGLAWVPTSHGGVMLGLLALGCLAAATQDIATDGLAAERLGADAQATANGLQVGGMMAGMLLGGAGALAVVEPWGLPTTLGLLAGVVALTLGPVLAWRETAAPLARPPEPARLGAYIRRPGAGALGLVLAVFALGRAIEMALARLLLVDLGWSLASIGLVVATGNAVAVIVGAGVAPPLVRRWGPLRVTLLSLGLVCASSAAWAGLALSGEAVPTGLGAGLVALGGMGNGLASVAVFTLAFRFAHAGIQAGTDMTVLQCLHGLGEALVLPLATLLTARAGYGAGFALAVGAALGAGGVMVAVRHRLPPPAIG